MTIAEFLLNLNKEGLLNGNLYDILDKTTSKKTYDREHNYWHFKDKSSVRGEPSNRFTAWRS